MFGRIKDIKNKRRMICLYGVFMSSDTKHFEPVICGRKYKINRSDLVCNGSFYSRFRKVYEYQRNVVMNDNDMVILYWFDRNLSFELGRIKRQLCEILKLK